MSGVFGRYLLGVLCVLALALSPAFAEVPQAGVIDPGHGIGSVVLGMTADQLLASMGQADFQTENDDGTILYEWELISPGDVPDATLWVVVDDGTVVRVGTDGAKYQTSSGLRVGSSGQDFIRQYGVPTESPAPGSYVFPQGIGIVVGPGGTAAVVWVEAADQ